MKRTPNFKTTLFACSGLVVLLALAASTYSLYTVHRLRSELKNEIGVASSRLDETRQIAIGLANMRSAMRGVTLFSVTRNPDGVTSARSLFKTSAAQIEESVRRLTATALPPEDASRVNAIRSGLEQWLSDFTWFDDLCASGHADEANRRALNTMTPVINVIQKSATDLGNANRVRGDAAQAEFETGVARNETAVWLLTLLLLCAATGAFIVVLRLVGSLRAIAQSVAVEANHLAGASKEISVASQSLAQGSCSQAASLEQTSASTAEINAMSQRNLENSQAAVGLVSQSGEKLSAANRSLDSMVVAMAEINTSSGRISKIIRVIDEIAFQTNILALNAAVEAARAGQAGAGFAVVADEVRNLAHRCAQAAQETTTLIEESVSRSSGGKAKVDEVAEAIRQITGEAVKVRNLVEDVSVSSREQARGIEQIGQAIAGMEQVTQSTAAGAEETSSSAEQLRLQSVSMKDVVERLTALVGSVQS